MGAHEEGNVPLSSSQIKRGNGNFYMGTTAGKNCQVSNQVDSHAREDGHTMAYCTFCVKRHSAILVQLIIINNKATVTTCQCAYKDKMHAWAYVHFLFSLP